MHIVHAQPGKDSKAWQSFSYIPRQAQHRQPLPYVPKASIAILGKVFHGLTSKHSIKAVDTQAGKDSPDSFAAGFFLTVKYSIYRLGFSYTDRHGNISFSEVVFSLTGKYSTYTLGFSYTDRHGHHSLKVVFLFGVHTRKHAQ
jgi:hypothetical protein